MSVEPFRLYGLPGCPACMSAESFLREKKVPVEIIITAGDPIALGGLKAVTGEDKVPVLLSRLSNEVITGFVTEEYERIAKIYHVLLKTGSLPESVPEKENCC